MCFVWKYNDEWSHSPLPYFFVNKIYLLVWLVWVNSIQCPVSAYTNMILPILTSCHQVYHWHVILGQWHSSRILWVNEQCGLCTLRTKLVLWVSQEDLVEGHLSTKTPPCCLFLTQAVTFWAHPHALIKMFCYQRCCSWCISAQKVDAVKQ